LDAMHVELVVVSQCIVNIFRVRNHSPGPLRGRILRTSRV
jgi:hypothetical protein